MASVKKSVRLIDQTINVCRVISRVSKVMPESEINWSGSLNSMAAEYALIMEENKPELTQDQWNALYSLYNGYMPSEDAQREARLLSWHISEGYQYDSSIAEMIGSEEQAVAFIEEVKGWSLTKQLSAIYFAKAFWSAVE